MGPRHDSLTVESSFLLVSLYINAILGEMTKGGEGLRDAYAATLSRMKAQPRSQSKLSMEVLMWVSHVERPLHVDELYQALGVGKDLST